MSQPVAAAQFLLRDADLLDVGDDARKPPMRFEDILQKSKKPLTKK